MSFLTGGTVPKPGFNLVRFYMLTDGFLKFYFKTAGDLTEIFAQNNYWVHPVHTPGGAATWGHPLVGPAVIRIEQRGRFDRL
jgi:hypothetical protein